MLRRLIVLVAILMFATCAIAQVTRQLDLGASTLTMSDEWIVIESGKKLTALGTKGEMLEANSVCIEQNMKSGRDRVDKVAEETIGSWAKEGKWKAVRGLTRRGLNNNDVIYSTASEWENKLGQPFFVIRLLFGSERGIAFVTVRGEGDATAAFNQYVETISSWTENGSSCPPHSNN